MRRSERPDAKLSGISFDIYSAEEIRQISIKEVNQMESFDRLTGERVSGGLYDRELGSCDEREVCQHCTLDFWHCPGHLSHIEFPAPILHPMFFETALTLLRISCPKCHTLPETRVYSRLLVLQNKALSAGHLLLVSELAEVYAFQQARTRESVKRRKASRRRKIDDDSDDLTLDAEDDDDDFSVDTTEQQNILLTRLEDLYTRRTAELRSSVCDGNHILESGFQQHREQLAQESLRYLTGIARSKCPHCLTRRPQILSKYRQLFVHRRDGLYFGVVDADAESNGIDSQSVNNEKESADDSECKLLLITATEVRRQLRLLYVQEGALLDCLYPCLRTNYSFPNSSCKGSNGSFPIDKLFIDALLVPAPSSRPPARRDGLLFEHPSTSLLSTVLKGSMTLRQLMTEEKLVEERGQAVLRQAHCNLQKQVNALYDQTLDSGSARHPGLKQRLEKKAGLIRKHMMGKRVDFACRSVISPDPNLAVDEVGLPEIMVRALTYPEAVTQWNVAEMRRLVRRGPDRYPGATALHFDGGEGEKRPLPIGSHEQSIRTRRALARELMPAQPGHAPTLVLRHVKDGDPLIMNRQPSLHRPSMQAHRVKVMYNPSSGPPLRTIRMHYANCKAYNADFDGDEMNGHLVQGWEARAEALGHLGVPHQYLTPKDGTPLQGLIQDHIIAAVHLTRQDRFLNRAEYFDLVHWALSSSGVTRYKLLPPSIIKPMKLWTGKQVISSLLLSLQCDGSAPLTLHVQGKRSKVELWDGDRGSELAEMSDIHLVVRQSHLLSGLVDKAHIGPSSFGLLHCVYEAYGPLIASKLLTAITRVLNRFLHTCGFTLGIGDVLLSRRSERFRRQQFALAPATGTLALAEAFHLPMKALHRGPAVASYARAVLRKDLAHLAALDAAVKRRAQVLLDRVTSRVMPAGLLKPFPLNNLQLMIHAGAKGSIVNAQQMSVALGQIELEGKRMAPMMSGRTLPSFRLFDASPRAGGLCLARFLSGLPPQELFYHTIAGRDGLVDTAVKTSRCGYLQRSLVKHLEGLVTGYDLTVRQKDSSIIQFNYGDDGLSVVATPFLQEAHLSFYSQNLSVFEPAVEANPKLASRNVRRAWRKHRRICQANCALPPFTVLSTFRPDLCFGSLSEKMHATVQSARLLLTGNADWSLLQDVLFDRSQRALVQPGEPVGLLAAQSIGEPSTQMTLNTFHFAGRGELNVTLGIPRLREILMMASANIKTPTVEVPVMPDQDDRVQSSLLRRLNKLYLHRVLQPPVRCLYNPAANTYTLELRFLRHSAYSNATHLGPKDLMRWMEHNFMPLLARRLDAAQRDLVKSNLTTAASMRVSVSGVSAASGGLEESGGPPQYSGFELECHDSKENVDIAAENEAQTTEDIPEWTEEDGMEALRQGAGDDADEAGDFDGEAEEIMEMGGRDVDSDNESNNLPRNVEEEIKAEDQEDVAATGQEALAREEVVLSTHSSFVSYHYGKRWIRLEVRPPSRIDLETLVTNLCSTAVVYAVRGVERALLEHSERQGSILRTEGVNLQVLFRQPRDLLQLDRLYSNNVMLMLQTYGVEAARATICREVRDVFQHYGIEVNPRHLSLLADYMTANGDYRAFNRHGMRAHYSPLQRMSFETTASVLRDTVLQSQHDFGRSPTSAIVLGQACSDLGTGMCDIRLQVTAL